MNKYIDATATTSCFGRFINLAPSGSVTNVKINSHGHIAATKKSHVSEEILMPYNRGKPSFVAVKRGRGKNSGAVAAAAHRSQKSRLRSLACSEASNATTCRQIRAAKRVRHSQSRLSSLAEAQLARDIKAAMAASIRAKPTGLLGSSIPMGAGGEAAVQLIDLLGEAPRTTVSVSGTLESSSPLVSAVPGSGHHCQSVPNIPPGRHVNVMTSTSTKSRGPAFLRAHA